MLVRVAVSVIGGAVIVVSSPEIDVVTGGGVNVVVVKNVVSLRLTSVVVKVAVSVRGGKVIVVSSPELVIVTGSGVKVVVVKKVVGLTLTLTLTSVVVTVNELTCVSVTTVVWVLYNVVDRTTVTGTSVTVV